MIRAWMPLVLLIANGVMATHVTATELYRWVDEHGRVHFSDQPRGHDDDPGVERLRIEGPRPLGQDENVRAIEERTRRLRDAETSRQQEEQQRVQQRREQYRARCDGVRREIRVLAGRVRYRSEDGSTYEVSPERARQDRERLEKWYAEHCR